MTSSLSSPPILEVKHVAEEYRYVPLFPANRLDNPRAKIVEFMKKLPDIVENDIVAFIMTYDPERLTFLKYNDEVSLLSRLFYIDPWTGEPQPTVFYYILRDIASVIIQQSLTNEGDESIYKLIEYLKTDLRIGIPVTDDAVYDTLLAVYQPTPVSTVAGEVIRYVDLRGARIKVYLERYYGLLEDYIIATAYYMDYYSIKRFHINLLRAGVIASPR